MRLLAAALLLAVVAGAAPAAACPVEYIEGASVIAAPGTGPNPTVILDSGSAVRPWQVYRVLGARGDGTPEVVLPVRMRRIPGTSLALLDIPLEAGYADIWMGDAIGAMAHLRVDIDPPVDYFHGWDDRVWRAPDVLEPAAPAWRTPAIATTGGAIAALMLALGMWVRRRRRRIVAVP